jgi:NADP-dependent 3-hydroxy acid dehydrogenase YdfG
MNEKFTPDSTRCKAVVTGAGQGLVRAMALGLLQAGHPMLLADRPLQALQGTMQQLWEQGFADRAFCVTADLMADEAVATIMDAADRHLGGST